MKGNWTWLRRAMLAGGAATAVALTGAAMNSSSMGQQQQQQQQQEPGYLPGGSFMPIVIEKDFEDILREESAAADAVMAEQRSLLGERYDLSDRPTDVMMSGGRKPVQEGVRVRLPEGVTWDDLNAMTPEAIRQQGLFPKGFLPLPHAKHETGGMVFPETQIEAIRTAEQRNLERFDVSFDLPEHFLPEYPPPLFLTSRPDLGDVSQGQALTIKNYYDLLSGIITPVQLEGMRLLLTPFPQQQFNATHDRKVVEASPGVTCLDCHTNGHTNAAFHLNPDTRPQAARFRIDTVSLRGMFNQQIHGSKRSLRSVEDFTEFEQRTAYFDGDQVTAAKKGINVLDRGGQTAVMAQMQNMFDFPPAPKLLPTGRLDPDRATDQELRGEAVFFGKGECAACHAPPVFMDNLMHDLKVERFYEPQWTNGQHIQAEGPIKTFTLRGIKDSPPYLHDGRLLTLADTVEFFNLVLDTGLTQEEKDALVTYMLAL